MSKTEFVVRLRGKNNTWQDLVSGNSWNVTGITGYDLTTTAGKFGGEALDFNAKTVMYLNTTQKSVLAQDDFTISCWVKSTLAYNAAYCPSIYESYLGSTFTMICLNLYRANTSDKLCLWWDKGYGGYTLTDIAINDGIWHHVALTQKDGIKRLFVDGVLKGSANNVLPNYNILLPPYSGHFTVGSLSGDSGQIPNNYGAGNYFEGVIDDLCILDEALWTSDFTPPTDYLMLNGVIYLTGQEAWGIDSNGDFSKLNNNYSTMTDAQKIAMFKVTDGQIPTIAQLQTLTMPIKAVNYQDNNVQPACTVAAIPEPQIIMPEELISIEDYKAVKNVSVDIQGTGNGIVKVAVTHDLSTYEVWENNSWAQISDIESEGMTPTELSNIPQEAWTEDFNIVYYLETPTIEDNKKINTLTLTVDTLPILLSQTIGTDYTYQYERPNLLSITFNQDGNYVVNYKI